MNRGSKIPAIHLAKRARRAPYDRRWWCKGPQAEWLAAFIKEVERQPGPSLPQRIRDTFAVWQNENGGSDMWGETNAVMFLYANEHRGKALTAKIIECRVRARVDLREDEEYRWKMNDLTALISKDPPAESEEGRKLLELATWCEDYEKRRFGKSDGVQVLREVFAPKKPSNGIITQGEGY